MNKTIQAQVNPRLLTKASRLFTGSLRGRIIEILQNARRAGATEVRITNANGVVSIHDNGSGIENFEKLLDLGGSGWDEDTGLEASEDPAGVGLFCLAPRKLTVRSNGLIAVFEADGWTGKAVELSQDTQPVKGTVLQFEDEQWKKEEVEPLAVFTGMAIIVDGEACAQQPFISEGTIELPGLGCRVKVTTREEVAGFHQRAASEHPYGTNLYVNFHGQVVGMEYKPIEEHSLAYMVELTGEPTGIRLMLPARTRLIENEALAQLKAELERQSYLYLQRLGRHQLPYKLYLRARELGIELPEAEQVYRIGLIGPDEYDLDPVEVEAPKDWPLSKCYRLSESCENGDETAEANAHLLAALGTFEPPFVPVYINPQYDGYSWAKLPVIERVEVTAGKQLGKDWVWSGQLIAVDTLKLTAHASNGKTFSSNVCMAIRPEESTDKQGPRFSDGDVYLTMAARDQLQDTHIWHHVGGYSEEGDTWDTQQDQFNRQLQAFWMKLLGPDEPQRQRLFEATDDLERNWRTVTIRSNGNVTIIFKDGTRKVLAPPRTRGA